MWKLLESFVTDIGSHSFILETAVNLSNNGILMVRAQSRLAILVESPMEQFMNEQIILIRISTINYHTVSHLKTRRHNSRCKIDCRSYFWTVFRYKRTNIWNCSFVKFFFSPNCRLSGNNLRILRSFVDGNIF